RVAEPAGEQLDEERAFDPAFMLRKMVASLGPEQLALLGNLGVQVPAGDDGAPNLDALATSMLESMRDSAPIDPIVNVGTRDGVEGSPEGGFYVSVSLPSTLPQARGIEVEVSGDALGLLDTDVMTAERTGETLATAKAELDGEVRRFR